MSETEISEKQLEILDFINEYLLACEEDAKEKLVDIIKEKFGDDGEFVLQQLAEDDDDLDAIDMEECPECDQAATDWTDEVKKKMDQFDVFLDDKYDDLIETMKKERHPNEITENYVKIRLIPVLGEDDVFEDEVVKLKNKILFNGIMDGWLTSEFFKGEE